VPDETLMNKKQPKLIFLISICFVLFGCQSTKTPEWYTSVKPDTSEYIYAVGEGRSLPYAKKSAANQINERLWTQVESSFYMREVSTERNSKLNQQNLVDNQIKTKTERLTLNGIEYLQQSQNKHGYYVEVRIKKNIIRKQLKEELNQLNLQASRQLKALKNSDKLAWWLKNKDADKLKQSALVRVAMLSVVDEKSHYNTKAISELQEKVDEVKNSILIMIKTKKNDLKLATLLSEQFSKYNIATTIKDNNLKTNTLLLKTERRTNKVGDAYITTLITDISINNNYKKVVASSEIISSGNSVTSYKMSSEGAMRHFTEQVEQQGLWKAIGFN